MKLFILAAGKGERLYPLTKNSPKSLLDLGDGTTILEKQINNAINCEKIDEVVIITGYKTEQIEAKVKDLKKDIKITIVYNPYYDISNNLMSLWCVHTLMTDDDFIVTNGDNIYKDYVFDKILTSDDKIQLTVDIKETYDEDDMKVIFKKNHSVARVSKEIGMAEAQAESVGLVFVQGSRQRDIFAKKLIELSKEKAYRQKFWLEIFNSLVQDGVLIESVEIDKEDWREMDYHPDIDSIRKELMTKSFPER